MKILHILDHSIPLHSGYTFRTRAILEQQRAQGWKTFHVTSAKHPYSDQLEEEVDGFLFHRTNTSSRLLEKTPLLSQLSIITGLTRRISELIEEIKPDIIHAHSPALNGLAALRAAKKHNIPVVYECRAFWEDAAVDHGTSSEGGIRYRLTKALETYVFRHADALTTICEGLRTDIIARGIPGEKITVIPNAVDIQRFTFGAEPDSELRAKLGLNGKTVLGFIGSFYAYEGLPLLIASLPRILESIPNLCVLLVGGGPEETLLREQVTALGLTDHVIFTGRVPHKDVQAYYNQVDIFVYPRLKMRLTDLVTPLKPLEAMAQGRMVIASDVGGHKELIKDGQTGFLFKAGDHESLANTVTSLISEQHKWSTIQHAARSFVEQERNWQKSVGYYSVPYNELSNR